jgi:hypothetical protein
MSEARNSSQLTWSARHLLTAIVVGYGASCVIAWQASRGFGIAASSTRALALRIDPHFGLELVGFAIGMVGVLGAVYGIADKGSETRRADRLKATLAAVELLCVVSGVVAIAVLADPAGRGRFGLAQLGLTGLLLMAGLIIADRVSETCDAAKSERDKLESQYEALTASLRLLSGLPGQGKEFVGAVRVWAMSAAAPILLEVAYRIDGHVRGSAVLDYAYTIVIAGVTVMGACGLAVAVRIAVENDWTGIRRFGSCVTAATLLLIAACLGQIVFTTGIAMSGKVFVVATVVLLMLPTAMWWLACVRPSAKGARATLVDRVVRRCVERRQEHIRRRLGR